MTADSVLFTIKALAPRLPPQFVETYTYAIQIAQSSATLRQLEEEIRAYAFR